MRTFETVEAIIVVLAVFLPVLTGFRLRRGLMSILLFAATFAQWVIEGYRWQIIILHIVAISLGIGDLLWEERRVKGLRRFRRAILGIPGVLIPMVLPIVLPIPELPVPSGPFEVGTQVFVISNPERIEAYGLPEAEENPDPELPLEEEVEEEEIPRRIVVQAWYPAKIPDGAVPQVWTPDLDVIGPALAERLGFPGFFLGHVDDVSSSSYPNATPLSGRVPVVLYSHGWTGFRTIAINQMESLASHGYLVLAADHVYGSIATRFPDTGEVVYLDPRALPDEEQTDPDDYEDAAEDLVEAFADDLVMILDELTLGDEGGFGTLALNADMENVGMFGHSTGGGGAARACLEDERCDAVVGFDAWVNPIPDRIVARELQIPSMFIRSDEWRALPNDRRLMGMSERSPFRSYWVGLIGAAHNDFVLTPLFSPYAENLGLKGPIDGDRVLTILDDYLIGFFDRYLLRIGGAVLDDEPPPEVIIEVFE